MAGGPQCLTAGNSHRRTPVQLPSTRLVLSETYTHITAKKLIAAYVSRHCVAVQPIRPEAGTMKSMWRSASPVDWAIRPGSVIRGSSRAQELQQGIPVEDSIRRASDYMISGDLTYRTPCCDRNGLFLAIWKVNLHIILAIHQIGLCGALLAQLISTT